jgi:hypothetical protein
MTKWSLRRPTERPFPPRTKFDRLNDDDLFDAIEQAVMNANVELGRWRTDTADRRGAHLALTETHLQTALGALLPLLRRQELRSSQ